VQAHVQALADRFVYVPAIGVFVMVVWAAADWFGRRAGSSGYAVAALALGGCVVMTSLQLRHWRNSLTLMQRVVQVEPSSYMARVMLGNALFERRDLDGALKEYEAGVRLRPG
jgi:protein O-mannosyl-transferase